MTKQELKEARRYLYEQNRKFISGHFSFVPRSEWPEGHGLPDEVYRSRDFLVMVYYTPGEPTRLSVCRAELGNDGRWKDGITWDELQDIKRAVGYGHKCAVEVYPPGEDVVNVANMRHLWIYDVPFRWRKEKAGQVTNPPGQHPINQPTEENQGQRSMNRLNAGNQGDSP
jgi:hypothetical protein